MNNLDGAWRVYGRTAALVLTVLLGVGVAGHLLPATLPLMRRLTPGFTLLTSLMVLAPALAMDGRRFAGWVAGTYAFTFLAEAVGVATGAVFGEYEYGPTLGLAWRGVPLLIAFNWVVVVHGACCAAGRALPQGLVRWRRPAIALLAGGIATAFNFIMEPVAIRLDYWHWAGGAIPFQNYAAWFVLAAATATFHPRSVRGAYELGTGGRLSSAYLLLQAGFFLALRIVWRLGAG